MQGTQPIRFQPIVQLSQHQIDPKYFKFGVTNFESDKYITIREEPQGSQPQLCIYELATQNFQRKPNRADSALQHPSQNIVALKAKSQSGSGNVIQVYNMDKKEKLKDITFAETISYWKWISDNKIALVTPTAIYHLDIFSQDAEKKVIDRQGAIAEANVQIIGYTVEVNEKWSALFGISSPDGGKTIVGSIQLNMLEQQKAQQIEGHCCVFGEASVHDNNFKSSLFCFFERKAGQNPKIQLSEISTPPTGFAKHKKQTEFTLDSEFPGDFPIVMSVSTKYGLLLMVTKHGFLYAYELTTNQLFYKVRISDSPIFVGTRDREKDGIYAINKAGSVILARIDPSQYIPHLQANFQGVPNFMNLVLTLAGRYQLQSPSVDNMFIEQFNRAFIAGDYRGAALVAGQAPGELIRNSSTIEKFKSIQPQPGQRQPIQIYYQTLLENFQLNQIESVGLVTPIIQQQQVKHLVAEWVNGNKLTLSEALGDVIKPYDTNLALQVYKGARAFQKAAQIHFELGQNDLGVKIMQDNNLQVDYLSIVKQSLIAGNAEGALNVAKGLYKQNNSINVHSVAELFLQANRFQEMTAFLVDCMKQNRPEDGAWQTKVLELNLQNAPQVAETILQMDQWNQFNRPRIAQLCEQKGLFQRALENYSELKDIKRVLLNVQYINPEWLTQYLSRIQAEWSLQLCQDIVRNNRNSVQTVVNVFVQNHQKFTVPACIKTFETVGLYEGIYLFLSTIISSIEDKDIYFKYIEASTKCNQLRVVESVIKDKKDSYDAVQVKDFLKELKLPDPKPLIFLCDIHGFVDELTKYLYKNNFNKFIEIYLFKVNPKATPVVIGTLIDLECDENYIKQLLFNVRGNCPIEQLIDEFERRNKVRVLESWLDSRVAEGNQIPAVHNALAKIKIDTNQDPENFLINNQFYDPKVIGKFCEDRDPHFAVIAYKRSWGTCDEELIQVTNKNSLFRQQSKYLVERQSKELWALVLQQDNPYRRQIIEQVVSVALPDSKNVEEVTTTVKAFMDAELPMELISLLEKIVLHNSEFGQYKKLQNLLIITAIKSDKTRVMDYINRLDNYDGPQIAEIALGEQYHLYEEAFVIYKKYNYNVEAVNVLLDNIEDFSRASEFAERVNQPEVWSRLGQAHLNQYQVVDAIGCFLKARDHASYHIIIGAAENDGKFTDLIKFLLMAREIVKDSAIDNSLAYSYARLDQITELEQFIQGSNSVDAQKVGDRCYDAKLYQAAKILYISIKNNSKIASCLVRLKEFSQAIESAKKANTPRTWKELCMACVEAQEFKLAAVAGMNIIIHPDHLEDLIKHYEEHGVALEMIDLLETGMGLERAHIGIYTELGILMAKYQPGRLMEHIKQYFSKLNVSKLLRTCEKFFLWKEAMYLHQNYDEYDNAIAIMMEHSAIAFQHELYLNLILKVANTDLYYRSIIFYLEEQPDKLNELLKSLTTKIDVSKVVSVMKKTGFLALIQPFMKSVQNVNNKELNEALNDLYLEQEDYDSLKQSISTYAAFDSAALAKQCENHELAQFRRIAAFLYRRAKQYEISMKISMKDQEYRDCIETAQESGKGELVEELLRFFVQQNEKEYFTACLYTAYELIRPDVVMELAWRFGLMEYAMPFFIQITRELTSRVDSVQKINDERVKKEAKQAEEQQNRPLDFAQHSDIYIGNGILGLAPPDPYNMQQNQFNQQQSGFGGGFGAPQGFGQQQQPFGGQFRQF